MRQVHLVILSRLALAGTRWHRGIEPLLLQFFCLLHWLQLQMMEHRVFSFWGAMVLIPQLAIALLLLAVVNLPCPGHTHTPEGMEKRILKASESMQNGFVSLCILQEL